MTDPGHIGEGFVIPDAAGLPVFEPHSSATMILPAYQYAWWKYVAPANGLITFDVIETNPAGLTEIYTQINVLTSESVYDDKADVLPAPDGRSLLRTKAGVTYYVRATVTTTTVVTHNYTDLHVAWEDLYSDAYPNYDEFYALVIDAYGSEQAVLDAINAGGPTVSPNSRLIVRSSSFVADPYRGDGETWDTATPLTLDSWGYSDETGVFRYWLYEVPATPDAVDHTVCVDTELGGYLDPANSVYGLDFSIDLHELLPDGSLFTIPLRRTDDAVRFLAEVGKKYLIRTLMAYDTPYPPTFPYPPARMVLRVSGPGELSSEWTQDPDRSMAVYYRHATNLFDGEDHFPEIGYELPDNAPPPTPWPDQPPVDATWPTVEWVINRENYYPYDHDGFEHLATWESDPLELPHLDSQAWTDAAEASRLGTDTAQWGEGQFIAPSATNGGSIYRGDYWLFADSFGGNTTGPMVKAGGGHSAGYRFIEALPSSEGLPNYYRLGKLVQRTEYYEIADVYPAMISAEEVASGSFVHELQWEEADPELLNARLKVVGSRHVNSEVSDTWGSAFLRYSKDLSPSSDDYGPVIAIDGSIVYNHGADNPPTHSFADTRIARLGVATDSPRGGTDPDLESASATPLFSWINLPLADLVEWELDNAGPSFIMWSIPDWVMDGFGGMVPYPGPSSPGTMNTAWQMGRWAWILQIKARPVRYKYWYYPDPMALTPTVPEVPENWELPAPFIEGAFDLTRSRFRGIN